VALRRLGTVAWVRSGGVVTRTGACLGADWRNRPAGRDQLARRRRRGAGHRRRGRGGIRGSFQLVHAAIRRRKPVLVVDLGGADAQGGLDGLDGPAGLAGALVSICADTGAPLHVFGASRPGLL